MIEKLCHGCYAARFPGERPRRLTWARECTECHAPTPSMSTLVKIEPAEVSS